MALASLEQHSDCAILELVRERGGRLRAALEALTAAQVVEVRGLGLMLGVELVADGRPATALAISIVQRALREGVILLADSPTSNVLSFAPPFAISDEEIAFVAERLPTWLAA
jgi:4-aminobutyrate aminotransferase-like enzyme